MAQLVGTDGRDTLEGGPGRDEIQGEGGDDFLIGFGGNDLLFAGSGDDRAAGGSGGDVVFGESGDDTLDGDDGSDLLDGGGGEDVLFAGSGSDIARGGAGNDELFGDDGSDVLEGGIGDDLLEGDAGADTQTGGAGQDTFQLFLGSFNPSSTFAAPDLIRDFEGAGQPGGDLLALRSERLVFRGEVDIEVEAGAPLPGAGNGVTELVYAVEGNRTWLLADENDDGLLDDGDFALAFRGDLDFTEDDFAETEFVIAGTEGDDTVAGGAGDDVIFGLGGADLIRGRGGNDELNGGEGNDTLHGGAGGFDTLNGDRGSDTLTLATSNFGGVASGGGGRDTLFGSDVEFAFSDLQGGGGHDVLNAGAAGANLDGGAGADRLVSGAGDDQMVGGRDQSFELDGAQDLFVYGAGAWGSDVLFDFEDGVDKFDLTGSGLSFGDLTIVNEEFQTTINSSKGTITILESVDRPVTITSEDFIF